MNESTASPKKQQETSKPNPEKNNTTQTNRSVATGRRWRTGSWPRTTQASDPSSRPVTYKIRDWSSVFR
jgi:hypothetical protein